MPNLAFKQESKEKNIIALHQLDEKDEREHE